MKADIEVRAEQVRTLYRQGTAVVVSGFVVSLIVTAVLFRSVPLLALLALPGALAVIGITRVALGRRYFRENPPATQATAWATRFVAGSSCAGLVWGIDVLVTDVVMPKLSGPELSERLKKLRPNLCTLFMSGYNRGRLVPAEDEKGGILFLEKPFTYDVLTKKVAALLALPGVADESRSVPRGA